MRLVLGDFMSLDGVVQAPAILMRTPTAVSPTAACRWTTSTQTRWDLFVRTETLWLRAFEGQPLETLAEFADVIAAWHRAGDWANQWLSLRHVFGICHLLRADELAVTIHGALERVGAVDAFPFEPIAAANLSKEVGELRQRLGDRRFLAAEQRGRTATTPVVIEPIVAQLRALTRSDTAGPPSRPSPRRPS